METIVTGIGELSAGRLLDHDGPIAKKLDGYQPRKAQQTLATAIDEAIKNKSILVAEAGTGTGKTFAYLVPALSSGKKTIISTGTKNLQDQLYKRDLPLIRKALAKPAKIAMLKGRANYLCKHRIETIPQEKRLLTKEVLSHLEIIRREAGRTQFGDTNEIVEVPEDSQAWYYATSTADNCLNQDCPYAKECYLFKARRKAAEADIVVVNHHLFFADLMLKDGGVGELLPDVDLIILDEAHQAPEIASQFFGERLSSRQLLLLASDAELEYINTAKDAKQLQKSAERLKNALHEMRIAMGDHDKRLPWSIHSNNNVVADASKRMIEELQLLTEVLQANASRSKQLEACAERAVELLALAKRMTGKTPDEKIHWSETYAKSFIIHFTPMNIVEQFKACMDQKKRGWVFTSATLTMNGKFDHFLSQLGLEKAKTLRLESPFDYAKQSLLYLPRYLPNPNDITYTDRVIEEVLPVIEASKGRAFILFTSFRAINIAQKILTENTDFQVFVQGDRPKDQLLEAFRKTPNAVLLGTSSFWEGVDVRGAALSCVIIDKLPFASPDDPVLQARSDQIRQNGGSPFYDYQLPSTAIMLQQGVGRLIRDTEDYGVLMICDPRLIARDYGRLLLGSLPRIPVTREIEKVKAFKFAE